MKALEGLKVLVAEDDALIAMHLQGLLEARGAAVTTVAAVAELLAYEPGEVDVLIADQTLRDGDAVPHVERFVGGRTETVFHTGGDVGVVRRRWPTALVMNKPATDEEVLTAVEEAAKRLRQR